MNILILADFRQYEPPINLNKVGGVDYHRTIIPGINLAKQYGHKVTFAKFLPKDCEYDVVIKNRTISNNAQDAEDLETIKRWGIPLVIDIDDYWHLPKEHILYDHWYQHNTDKRTEFAIESADLVWASIYTLAKKVKEYNQNVVIIKNAIDKEQPQFSYMKPLPYKGDVRIGWVGSIAHTHDFPVVRKGFAQLVNSNIKYNMNLFGFNPTDQNSVMIFSQYRLMCASKNVNFWNGTEPDKYANSYRQLDIAIAPLSSSEFNACKSELKLLEAAAFGLPVIASNCMPYYQNHFKKAVLFADRDTWYTHLKTLISSAKMRKHYGVELKKVVDKHYNIKEETRQRHISLCELTGKK